jgi:hypothetical protein
VNVETKEQSNQWMHTHSPNKLKKFKQMLSANQKGDGNCFMGQDRKEMPMVEFMQQGTTTASEVYCETLKKLCRVIQNKRRGMLRYGVVLPRDNACLHKAACTRAFQVGDVCPSSLQP